MGRSDSANDQPSPGTGSWTTNIALAAVAVTLTLLLVELVLRWTWSTEKVTLVHDSLLGFRGRAGTETIWHREMFGHPRQVVLNEGGFHDHPRQSQPAADTRRITMFGDSFLEAYQVDIDSSFAQRLGQRLSDTDEMIEAVNLGVHGYGLGVYLLQVGERLDAWNADAVLLCLFLGNDLHDNFAPIASPAVPRFAMEGDHLVEMPAPGRDLRVWLRDEVLARSSLGRWFWLRVIKSSGSAMALARAAGMVSTPDLARDSAGQHDHMLRTSHRLLDRLITRLEQRSLPLHVFLIPDPFLVHDLAQQERGIGFVAPDDPRLQTETMVRQVLTDRHVSYTWPRDLFVEANLSGDGVYRGGFGHFTDAAHLRVTDLLERPLKQLLFSDPGAWTAD